jgi:hypothetical protein
MRLELVPDSNVAVLTVSPNPPGDPPYNGRFGYGSPALRTVCLAMSAQAENPKLRVFAELRQHPNNPLVWRVTRLRVEGA